MKTNWIQRLLAAIADLVTRTKGLDDIHDDLATADGKVSYTEDSVSGTTANAYADAPDLDMRGAKALTAIVLNTDGANSLDYKVLARHADYAAGTDEEEQPEQTLAAGEKGLVQLVKGYSRVKIQVKSTVADSHAAYTVKYLINR